MRTLFKKSCFEFSFYICNNGYLHAKMTGLKKRECSSVSSSGKKFIKDAKDIGKGHERIHTYTDQYIGCFNRQSIKAGKIGAFSQNF